MSAMRSLFRRIAFKPPRSPARSSNAGRKMVWGGTTYKIADGGNIVRVFPLKPWHGKSERRKILKERRALCLSLS